MPYRRDERGKVWIDGRQFAAWVKARATLKKIIQTVKRFFTWLKLARVREYRDLSLAWIEALRRDQTAAALLLLSGIRASAFAMLPIAAVDLSGRTIKQ